MITDIIVNRIEGNISIQTATEAVKDDYVAFEMNGEFWQSLAEAGQDNGIDVSSVIWNDRYNMDCIMFSIVENESHKIIGFCEIEHLSTEPTIGITIADGYRGIVDINADA